MARKVKKRGRTQPKINRSMKAVMTGLYLGRFKWQNTNEISKISGLSWTTTRKYLKKLKLKNHVSSKKSKKRNYWKI